MVVSCSACSWPAGSPQATYAPAWGLWEGVRELLQNWHDGLLDAAGGASLRLTGADAECAPPELWTSSLRLFVVFLAVSHEIARRV